MFKKILKNIGMTIAPSITLELLSARSQKFIMRSERLDGRVSASCQFIEKNGRNVIDGPFKGMLYPKSTANERNLIHRLIGSYENELHPWIEEIARSPYPMLLDVGTADGYYAVGFGRLMPNTRIVGFDTDRWARRATQALIDANDVKNVEVLSMCNANWINQHVKAGTLIFSDCEGYEGTLFDPEECPILKKCDMLIELHERNFPNIESIIIGRFEKTHDYRIVTFCDHDPILYDKLSDIQEDMRHLVISEGRGGPQNVIFLTRRNF